MSKLFFSIILANRVVSYLFLPIAFSISYFAYHCTMCSVYSTLGFHFFLHFYFSKSSFFYALLLFGATLCHTLKPYSTYHLQYFFEFAYLLFGQCNFTIQKLILFFDQFVFFLQAFMLFEVFQQLFCCCCFQYVCKFHFKIEKTQKIESKNGV